MAWLKTVGCDCPECGPDPCTAGCACSFNANDAVQVGHDDTYDWTSVNAIDHDISVAVTNYAPCDAPISAPYYYRIQIDADGVSIYDSGCITGNLSTSTTVPAGTLALRIRVTPYCTAVDCAEFGGAGDWAVNCI